MTKYRNWCFTLFHTEEDDIQKLIENLEETKFYIFQLEEGEKENHRHLQGYVEFKNARRLDSVKKKIGFVDVHVERAKGNKQQNIEYCTKSKGRIKGPWEHGDRGGQGTRTDLLKFKDGIMKQVIERKVDMCNLVDEFPSQMIKYHKFAQWYTGELLKKTLGCMPYVAKKVFVLWGEPGTGKTRRVYETFPMEKVWRNIALSGSSIWFDGYYGQKIVLFDEYDGEIPIQTFLQLLDGYPVTVQVKGGITVWNPEYIIITSQKPSHMWYKDESLLRKQALLRRITKEYLLNGIDEIEIEFGYIEGEGKEDKIEQLKVNFGEGSIESQDEFNLIENEEPENLFFEDKTYPWENPWDNDWENDWNKEY